MPVRYASADWHGKGTLEKGSGEIRFGSEMCVENYSYSSRFKEGEGTNPEELIGASLAACYSMDLSNSLARAGFSPNNVRTEAKVTLAQKGPAFKIIAIELDCQARVPGIDEETFQEHALTSKENCPIAQVLAGVQIKLQAKLNERS